MTDQNELSRTFRALHVKGDPVVLFNIWDPGSAKAVAGAGAKALATGSWPVAAAFGFSDGEKIPLDLALENFGRICAAVDLPVSMDIEGGYGADPQTVAQTVGRAIEVGAVGFNFEDQVVGTSDLYDVPVQAARVEAAASAVASSGVPAFLNARTDLFLKASPDTHDDALLDKALERARAYEKAGADGFFAPGLGDERLIARLCEGTALPVNLLVQAHVPEANRLAELGVARISHGPGPYRQMIKTLENAARMVLGN